MLCFWKRFEAKQFCKFIGPMYNNSHFVCYVLLLQNIYHPRTTVKYSLVIKYKTWLTWEVYFIFIVSESNICRFTTFPYEYIRLDQKYFCNGSPSVLSIWLMTDWHIFSTSSSSSADKQNFIVIQINKTCLLYDKT